LIRGTEEKLGFSNIDIETLETKIPVGCAS